MQAQTTQGHQQAPGTILSDVCAVPNVLGPEDWLAEAVRGHCVTICLSKREILERTNLAHRVHLQHLPPTGRLCPATLPTNLTIQGLTTDINLLGGVNYFLGGVLFSSFRCFVYATETLTYSGTHIFIPHMLSFCLYPKKPTNERPHTCL